MKISSQILLTFGLLFFVSCKKTNDSAKHCWQIIDVSGNLLNQICNKSESEMLACVNSGACGTYNGGRPLTSCEYYQTDGDLFCWKINNRYYSNLTESAANVYAKCFSGDSATVPLKIACSSCLNYFTREQITTYAPTDTVYYTPISYNQYCGDSLAIVASGNHTIKSTPDTVIIQQFSVNGVDFQ
jgi:hypothetical protein